MFQPERKKSHGRGQYGDAHAELDDEDRETDCVHSLDPRPSAPRPLVRQTEDHRVAAIVATTVDRERRESTTRATEFRARRRGAGQPAAPPGTTRRSAIPSALPDALRTLRWRGPGSPPTGRAKPTAASPSGSSAGRRGARGRPGARTQALDDLFRDRCLQYAAAIAFRVLFSLFPLTILLVSIFGLVLQDDELRERVVNAGAYNMPRRSPNQNSRDVAEFDRADQRLRYLRSGGSALVALL